MGVATPYIAYIANACMGSMLFLGNISIVLFPLSSSSLFSSFLISLSFPFFPSPFLLGGGGGELTG